MKLLSTDQIRQWDAFTIQHEPISSTGLMERAARAFSDWFVRQYNPAGCQVMVFCGIGNNGGDGLVIGRLLQEKGYQLQVYVLRHTRQESPDFTSNLEKVKNPVFLESETDFPELSHKPIVIDALLGAGLNRPAEGIVSQLIEYINAAHTQVVAVDIASGLFADKSSLRQPVIRPSYTFSFQLPKLAFLLPENEAFVGTWMTANLHLHPTFLDQVETPWYFTDEVAVRKIFRPRSPFAHKGYFGHALLLAGSYGKMGAAVLACKACLRAGVGLLTAQVPSSGYDIMQTVVPEAMTLTDPTPNYLSELQDIKKYTVVGIGPGLGTHPNTATLLTNLLTNFRKPLVIDADGLNLLALQQEWLEVLPENSILTPHPKEFERLALREFDSEMERLDFLQHFCRQHGVIVVLKGRYTSVGLPNGELHFNSTGNPGMATAGSGDVLTGIITGLLSQGYTPSESAIMGVYLHGLAGDLAAREKGYAGLIASDLIDYLPQAIHGFELIRTEAHRQVG
jgi:hydroxyethylthiazole kinase-like uncharacterized protein yjeF